MEEKTDTSKKQKLKFDDSEYFLDDLPKEARQLVVGLRTADAQTKMYEDTLKLIALGKNKMVEDLKIILDKIEPIKNEWKYQLCILRNKYIFYWYFQYLGNRYP